MVAKRDEAVARARRDVGRERPVPDPFGSATGGVTFASHLLVEADDAARSICERWLRDPGGGRRMVELCAFSGAEIEQGLESDDPRKAFVACLCCASGPAGATKQLHSMPLSSSSPSVPRRQIPRIRKRARRATPTSAEVPGYTQPHSGRVQGKARTTAIAAGQQTRQSTANRTPASKQVWPR